MMGDVDPYSTEIRYTLDLMACYLNATHPRSVRIASSSAEMVKAVVRRLYHGPPSLLVESAEMQATIRDSLGIETDVVGCSSSPADAALFPFSLEGGAQPAGEPAIVAACHNALSYKCLLYPGMTKGTVFGAMARLKGEYRLGPVAGLYSPRFVLWWALAKTVEQLDSAWYFRVEDHAMRQLIEFGPLWRLSYVVVLVGRSAD